MKSDAMLERTLAALRDEESRVETPAHVETALMGAWDMSGRLKAAPTSHVGAAFRRPGMTSDRRWQSGLAVAAGVLLTIALTRLGDELRNTTAITTYDDAASLLLIGAPLLEGEPVRVVRMRMAAGALSHLGIRTTVHDPDAAIDVDVIVGEDGVARAITF